jgi:hypothetical protein
VIADTIAMPSSENINHFPGVSIITAGFPPRGERRKSSEPSLSKLKNTP